MDEVAELHNLVPGDEPRLFEFLTPLASCRSAASSPLPRGAATATHAPL
jgi:hypothetical protein